MSLPAKRDSLKNILYNLVTVSIFLITHFLSYNDIVKKTDR